MLLGFLIVAFLSGLPKISIYVQASSCSPAGGTGLTASVVAKPNQVVTGAINAASCDLGIYVGPGTVGVVIANATVTGGNDHGILVQDTTDTVIENNLITVNGINPHTICNFGTPSTTSKPCIANDYEVLLVGTSHALVKGNTVSYNPTDGGIGLVDDGASDPGAPNPGTARQSVANVIANNLVEDVGPGCDIIIASYNSGPNAGAVGNIVTGNLVLGSTPQGPYNGQIVIAANANNTIITGTTITNNIVDGSMLPGVAVHANFPGDVISQTTIEGNIISNNGWYPAMFASPNTPVAANGTVGISLVAEAYAGMASPPTVTGTSVTSNTILNDKYALWTCKAVGTNVVDLRGNASVPMVDCQGASLAVVSSTTTVTSAVSPLSTSPGQYQLGSAAFILVGIIIILVVGVVVWRKHGKA